MLGKIIRHAFSFGILLWLLWQLWAIGFEVIALRAPRSLRPCLSFRYAAFPAWLKPFGQFVRAGCGQFIAIGKAHESPPAQRIVAVAFGSCQTLSPPLAGRQPRKA